MPTGGTLRALAQEWIEGRERRGELSGRSPKVERARLNALLRRCGDRPPTELNRKVLLDWQADVGHQAPATRRATIGTGRKFLRWLKAEGHLGEDLTVHLVKVKEPRRAPRALPYSDVDLVLGTCPSYRARAVIRLMVDNGLRCVEISRLNLDDYDRGGRIIRVVGKGGHERVLPVLEVTANAIEQYIASERGWQPGPLFLAVGSKRGPAGRLSAKWISKRTGRIMAAAGVHRPGDRRTAHALRHTCATDVLNAGGNLRLVQQLLGHESLQSTEIYLGVSGLDELRRAMEARPYGRPSTMTSLEATALRGAPGTGTLIPATGGATEGPPLHHAVEARSA